MPPKAKFDKRNIVDAAFTVLRSQGRSALSAKAIAGALGGSTMPIYSYLNSMKQLEEELLGRAYDLLADYQCRRRTDDEFLDLALGSVLFARDEPHLYRFINHPDCMESSFDMGKALFEKILARFPDHPLIQHYGFNDAAIEEFGWMLWIFVHGLAHIANVAANEHVNFIKDETAIAAYLRKVGITLFEGVASTQSKV